ncbi:helix-turn-helix transcriptional regulator [Humibacter soli]
MGETTGLVAPTRRDLQSVLLEGKTSTPQWRHGSVSRRSVIDRARESSAGVVTVTAPAGYGKSTMLAEWAGAETRTVGWASLDRTDDDPGALLSVIATASIPFAPEAAIVAAEVRSNGSASLARSAPLLAAALSTAPLSFVLFIDDLHWADSDGCQDAIEVLLAAVPPGSQIVMASRHDHSLLARLRAMGAVQEIGPEDLRLDHAGARSVFEQAGATAVDDADLDTIIERCEGWPAGLYLSALVLGAGGDAVAPTGHDRYLADYLYRECMNLLPDETQSFLRRTSVLDQFTPSACNAVLEISRSRGLLHDLEAANLFLVPLDRERTWYRFHALFREFLQSELERVEGAEAVAELHRRAAAWHEHKGAAPQAVEHLLHAGDLDRAGLLVAEIALPMFQRGQAATVDRWLATLGTDVVRRNWPLVVEMCWMTVLFGNIVEGERWARFLNFLDADSIEDEEERLLFGSARAMVRAGMCEHGYEHVAGDAAFAFEHEPAESMWRDQAIYLWGAACLLKGDTNTAEKAFTEAIALADVMSNPDTNILSEPELALLAIDAGRWREATAHATRGVEYVDSNHMEGYPTTALALAVAARVAFHNDDRRLGDQLLARAMRARVGATYLIPWLATRVRLQLAMAHVAIGELTAAWHLLREIDEIQRRRGDLGALSTQVEEFRANLALGPTATGAVPLTPAELRLLPYLQTHLTIAAIGQRLYVSRNTVSSQVGSIYRKLSVTTRGAAVERAIELGLLGR